MIGPSASGKSTVVRTLAARALVRVHPTWTTRPRRPDEMAGEIEHRFVSEATFARLDADGFFLGTVALAGLPHRYGLPRVARRGDDAVDTIMARAPFVARVYEEFPHAIVYQIEDTPQRARRRLLERGTSMAEVAARLDALPTTKHAADRELAARTFVNDTSLGTLVDQFTRALADDFASVFARNGSAA